VMLGAGGAGRAMAVEIAWAGAAHLTLVTRREEQGREVAERVRHASGVPCEWQQWESPVRLPTGTTMIMNATHLGCAPGLEPVPVDWETVAPGCLAVDVITNPRITPFLRAARERGCPVVDGVEMLVQLAMQIFEQWTGIRPEEAVFQRAVADALGDDVAGAGEGLGGVFNFRFLVLAVVGGVLVTDEFLGFDDGIGGIGLGKDEVGKGLEALLFGDGSAGALFRTERKIDVLEDGERIGGVDGFFEGGREEVAFLERGEDGGAAFVDGAHLLEAVADGGDLDLVEFAGGLFAVAGDERHGGALGKKLRGGGDLVDLEVEFLRDTEDVVGVGQFHWFLKKRAEQRGRRGAGNHESEAKRRRNSGGCQSR